MKNDSIYSNRYMDTRTLRALEDKVQDKALTMLARLTGIKSEPLRKNIIHKINVDTLTEMVFYYADGDYVGHFSYIYLARRTCEKFILACVRKFGMKRSKAIEKVFYSFKEFQAFKW